MAGTKIIPRIFFIPPGGWRADPLWELAGFWLRNSGNPRLTWPSRSLADSDKFRQLSECDSEHPANATAQLRGAVRVAARRCARTGASGSTCTGRYPPEMNARGRGRKIFSTEKYSGMFFVPAKEFGSCLASIGKWTPCGEREDISPSSPLHNAGEA